MNDSPIAEAEQLALAFSDALEKTGLVQIIEPKVAINQIHLLARVKKEHERDLVHVVAFEMLKAVAPHEELFIGKSFFLRGGKLKYAWVLSAGSDNLYSMMEALVAAIDASMEVPPEKKIEVMESPLMGPPTPQSDTRSGTRGAAPVR